MAQGLTLQQLQNMGAKPATSQTGGLTLQQLQTQQKPTNDPLNGFSQIDQQSKQGGVVGGTAGKFASSVNNDLTQAGTDFASAITKAPQRASQIGIVPAVAESGLRAAGAAGGGLLSFASDVAKTIPGVSALLDHIGANLSAQTSANQNGLGSKLVKILNEMAMKHPEITKDVGAATNIAGAVGGMKGLTEIGANAPKFADTVAETAKNLITKNPEATIATDNAKTWDMIKPNLTPTEQAQAVTEGKIQTKGVLGTVTQIPKGAELEMIDAAKPYVTEAKNPIEAVSNMQNGIAEKANTLKTGLDETGAIYTKSQIQGALSKIETPTMISSDATLNRAYGLVKQKMLSLVGDGGKLGDLLDARKSFDAFINKQFPNLYSSDTLTPMRSAVLDIRNAVNDVIDSRLPEGKLSDGTSFRDSLRQQSMLYRAIDNVAPKVGKVGTNAVTALIKAHPTAAKVVKYGAGAAGLGILGREIIP